MTKAKLPLHACARHPLLPNLTLETTLEAAWTVVSEYAVAARALAKLEGGSSGNAGAAAEPLQAAAALAQEERGAQGDEARRAAEARAARAEELKHEELRVRFPDNP